MTDTVKTFIYFLIMILFAVLASMGRDMGYSMSMLVCMVAVGALAFRSLQGKHFKPANPNEYFDSVVRAGVIATAFWGVVGFSVGTYIAFQLIFEQMDWHTHLFTFGRLRPLHTSAVIFAFGGNALMLSSFYIVQRTSGVRLWGGNLAWFVFWGYQLFIVLAAVGYLFGTTQSREYAEPEWFVDIWLTVVWVCFIAVFVGTLATRKEKHIYVANWFLLSFMLTTAMLHLMNNLSVPVSLLGSKSYSAFSGVQDALLQWWYGHNAVGFFLTAGFLGMMYYYIPKQANRPVYSYKLSIVHFWAVIFIYIWAGPHHLHFTALPDWAQFLGMVFSIVLWMPSWGGMINGLMTLSGAWDKLRTDPVIRFLVVSVAFYGMATFEGPMMSIRTVNSLSHYTDWTIGHVHSGALGWNGMISFGALYFLTPRLWGREALYSTKLVSYHFWLAMLGIVLYASSMWVSGIMEGLMWRETNEYGALVNSFADTVMAKTPMYFVRGVGGLLYVAGALIMIYNLYKTVTVGKQTRPITEMVPAE